MAEIRLQQLAHSYHNNPDSESDYALKTCDYLWEDGGAYALLGPSGCGKTTLLKIISGLLQPSQGKVLFDGVDVTAQSPRQRNIAQVFQFPVIYDAMSVYDNLAFPLRNRKLAAAAIDRRVQEVAEMLDLQANLKQRARGLSADLKQMISLGRGLVREDVSAILFDEPLTVIDPHLKFTLRRKLKQVHERYRHTLIYVTHDQGEALTFADQVAVMSEGTILQVGTPQQLFEKPVHRFLGHFIGSPGMNFLDCQVRQDEVVIDGHLMDGHPLRLADGIARRAGALTGRLELGVRPEFVRLCASAETNTVPVSVQEVQDLGNYQLVNVQCGKHMLKVKVVEAQDVQIGAAWLQFPADMTRLYNNGHLVE
ncbi:MAG: ABC transporter ATP-binding protein [Pseudohongiellaceae bacterium]